ncbi:MAG: hypothetical protein AB2A00_32030 [Myxococcota bacterium]
MHLERIERELEAAVTALTEGNEGKARVCARRAAGQAVAWLMSTHPLPGFGTDAMAHLTALQRHPDFPDEVRAAAVRLTTSVRDRDVLPFSTDPLGDARIIVAHVRSRLGVA